MSSRPQDHKAAMAECASRPSGMTAIGGEAYRSSALPLYDLNTGGDVWASYTDRISSRAVLRGMS